MTYLQQATAEDCSKPQKTAAIDRELIDGAVRVVAVTEQKRAQKGSVVVYADRGWLKLRWSWSGKRFFLTIGLPDSKGNRLTAERKAKLIERDILAEQFDPSLERYRPQDLGEGSISLCDLFEQFINHKQKQIDPRTLEKYWGLLGYLRQYFRQKKAPHLTEEEAFAFREWLIKRGLAPVTIKERLGLLRSCWQWGIKRKQVRENPWLDVKLKAPPRLKPNPFSSAEVRLILDGFRSEPNYCYYTDFAEFLLSTGCRIGEAIGLRWKHLSADCSGIWIGEAYSRGRRTATKTNTDRRFDLTPRIQEMLLARRPEDWQPDNLVFPSAEGRPISDSNFRKRAWKPILAKVGVPYRMPRISRHSFASRAIEQGVHPVEVSEITGHSVQTLYRHYLGNVRGRAKLPDLD